MKITQNSQHWLLAFFLPIVMLFGWSRVELPVCRGCKWKFRLQRWARQWTSLILIGLAIWLLMPLFDGWQPFIRKIVVAVLVLVCLLPYVMFEMFWPRYFTTTAEGDAVEYEFASEGYAEEFLDLNVPDDQLWHEDQEPSRT